MKFIKADKISTIVKKCCKPLPLFSGVISIILLISASVPGQLEQHEFDASWALISICVGIASILRIPPQWLFNFVLLSIISLEIYYFYHRWHKGDKLQISQILSLSIIIITSLLLSNRIPAKINFHTSATEFDRVLMQEILNNRDRKPREIGNFTILSIHSDTNPENTQAKSIYFTTKEVSSFLHESHHGFAYLSDSSKTSDDRGTYTHIYGKWYIFIDVSEWLH
jgi:hypothetical protein